ncbi:MAG: hypothetical protein J6C04_01120 [Oscillospiraceae bacterium]|nr:hypothetical protein [Oscillospiraceae bacterium]
MSYIISADYKNMYYTLFRNVNLAIEAIEEKNYIRAEYILRKAQEECEDIFIDTYEEQKIDDGKENVI